MKRDANKYFKLVCLFFASILVLMQSTKGQGQDSFYALLLNLIAPLCFVFALTSDRGYPLKNIKEYLLGYILLFVFIFIIPSIFILITDSSFLKDFYQSSLYITLPLISVFFINYLKLDHRDYEEGILIIFAACIISLLPKLLSGNLILQLIAINISGESRIDTESDIVSFMFGLLTIYFFTYKKYKLFLVALIFSVLSFKRIVITGIIVSLFIYLIFQWMPKIFSYKKLILVIVLLVNITIPFLMLEATNDSVFAQGVSEDWFDTDIESLTMGRKSFYSVVTQKLGEPKFLGVGFGKARTEFVKAIGSSQHIHSDLIKLLYELGIIGYCIWVFFWYKNNIRLLNMFVLSIYLNVLFISDNVFVYFPTLLLYYLIQSDFILYNEYKILEKHFFNSDKLVNRVA